MMLSDLTLESLNYQTNYNTYGVRRTSGLYSPKLFMYHEMLLPRNSIYHHLDMNDTSIGPLPDDEEIAKYPQRIMIHHLTEARHVMGNPRKAQGNPARVIVAEYKRKYRKLRTLNNFERTVNEENTLLVMNYNILTRSLRYPPSRYAGYFKWHNLLKQYFEEVNARMIGNSRHHFISFEMPARLPSRRVLIMGQQEPKALNPALLSLISRPQYMFLVELWKWLGENRKDSLMGVIDEANYGKLNLIIKDQGKWCMINVERLQGMIGDTDDIDDNSSGATGSASMQRNFLRFLSSVMTLRSGAPEAEEDIEDTVPVEPVPAPAREDDPTPDIAPPVVMSPTKKGNAPVSKKEVVDKPTVSTTAKEIASKAPHDTGPVRDVPDAPLEEDELEGDAEDEAKNIEELNVLLDEAEGHDRPSVFSVAESDDPSDVLKAKYEELAEMGTLTVAEYKRLEKLREKTAEIPNPYGKGTLVEFSKIDPALIKVVDKHRKTIPKIKGVVDPSMLEASLDHISSTYIKEVLQRDVSSAVLDLQRGGIIVQSYDVKEVEVVGSNYFEVSVRVAPIDGGASTLRFRYPKVNEMGVFEAGGVKYRMKHQRGDLPIRKVSPSSVALTSYYAKVFVDRSERAVVNYPRWITRQINALMLDNQTKTLTNVKHTDVSHHEDYVPRIYTILASNWESMTIAGKYDLMLDYKERYATYTEKMVKGFEDEGYVVCGQATGSKGKYLVMVDYEDQFYVSTAKGIEPLGSIEDMLSLDAASAPTETAEFRLFSKNVPVGVVLGYFYGLKRLLSILGVRPRRVTKGSRLSMEPHEYAVRFLDESLILSRRDKVAMMIVSGLNRYHREIARYSIDSFDSADVYVNIMEEQGMRVGFMRELDLAMDMFVDHITREVLKEMKEPTSLDKLLIRSVELLVTDWHPRENDRLHQRDKGYERMAGHVYSELVRSVRKYRSRGIGKESKVEINPNAVWMEIIANDSSVFPIEESNPIRDVKEREDASYAGTGGRSLRSMVKRTRAFTKSDLGLTSEATVDSGSTGVNFSLPPNPNMVSLRGVGKAYDASDSRSSSLVSSSMLMAPNADQDDAKRMNFISIQHSHGVAAAGGEASPYATGYDKVLAHRTSDLFASTAKDAGVISEYKEDRYIKVLYKNGTEVKIPLGVDYGTVTGTTVPHHRISDFRKGDKVKLGDVITYHKGFFQPDPLDPGQVLWKMGVIAKTAFIERPNTYEDSCEINMSLADKFVSPMTNIRDVLVDFRSGIRNLAQIGDTLDSESILCILEDEVTRSNDMFDEESLQTLTILGGNAPRSENAGRLDKIEVFYHGDIEDMSADLAAIVNASDSRLKRRLRDKGMTPLPGRVDDTLRIGKEPLDVDTAVMRFYITEDLSAGEGDKGVLANQMKTIISNVFTGDNTTESGAELDLLFSYMSVANRMVESCKIMGTTISLLKVMSRLVFEYHNEK